MTTHATGGSYYSRSSRRSRRHRRRVVNTNTCHHVVCDGCDWRFEYIQSPLDIYCLFRPVPSYPIDRDGRSPSSSSAFLSLMVHDAMTSYYCT